jgi:pyruvate,water dikinase
MTMTDPTPTRRPPSEGRELVWEPPGPGFWEWGGSHVPNVPTPIYGELHMRTIEESIGRMFTRYGVPLRTMAERRVNGRLYTSLQPLVGKAGSTPPPKPVLWLALRLHPEMRRRNKTAAAALRDRIWRARTVEWRRTLRPGRRAANLGLQAEDLGAMDDASLAGHVERAHANLVDGALLHFDLHGDDMGPLGLYCSTAVKAGVDPGLAIAALAGHSPSTAAAVEALRRIFDAAVAAGWSPARGLGSIDDLRALGPDVAAALDDYLDEYGWRVVTGYDIDSLTVRELPEALLTNVIASGTDRAPTDGDAAAEALRTQVPLELLAEFDAGLAEARVALDLRDDNGPINVQWPTGLLRRALLEAGRRLRDRGQLSEPDLAVELTLAEVTGALRGDTTLHPAEVSARAATRAADSAVVPPATLGAPDPEPDLSAFPAALAAVTVMARTAVALLERSGAGPATNGAVARGLGVGTATIRGTARVARSPEDALAAIKPGDVLVVPFTTPAYNAVLSVAGAVVTEEGGALSHAAVLARELGIPAVIGAAGAVTAIPDGAEVEVDPATGSVRLLDA